MKKRYLIIVLVFLAVVSLFLGIHSISLKDILQGNEEKISVFLISRVPRLISLIVAGIGLSISGVIMQQVSNNKFISPTTSATIDSAQFGMLISMTLFSSAGLFIKMTVSFIFALLGTFIFLKIMNKVKYQNVIFIPLVGIILGNVIGSITNFFAYKFDFIQNMSTFM